MLRMVKYAMICIFTATLRALDPPPTNSLGKSTKKVLSLLPELSILYFQEISIQHQYSEYTRDICIKSALGNEQISPIWNLFQITSMGHMSIKINFRVHLCNLHWRSLLLWKVRFIQVIQEVKVLYSGGKRLDSIFIVWMLRFVICPDLTLQISIKKSSQSSSWLLSLCFLTF